MYITYHEIHHLKVYLLYYNRHHKLIVGYFISPVTNSSHSQLSLFRSPWQLSISFLSLQTSFCWMGHISGLIVCALLWLASFT